MEDNGTALAGALLQIGRVYTTVDLTRFNLTHRPTPEMVEATIGQLQRALAELAELETRVARLAGVDLQPGQGFIPA